MFPRPQTDFVSLDQPPKCGVLLMAKMCPYPRVSTQALRPDAAVTCNGVLPHLQIRFPSRGDCIPQTNSILPNFRCQVEGLFRLDLFLFESSEGRFVFAESGMFLVEGYLLWLSRRIDRISVQVFFSRSSGLKQKKNIGQCGNRGLADAVLVAALLQDVEGHRCTF